MNENRGKGKIQSDLTPRDPHYRRYQIDEKVVVFYADSIGQVQVTEELLDTILTELGYVEVTDE